jgi:transposase
MRLYCGIDLHSDNSVVSVIDDEDRIHYEKRLPNDLAVIEGSLLPYREALVGVVVESTYNWYWLVDGLQASGFEVRLANTVAMKQYSGLKYTNDQTDARSLGQLLRLGILPEGYIYPKAERGVRDLLRRRLLLVGQRTAQHLSLQSLFARQTGERMNATVPELTICVQQQSSATLNRIAF